MSWQIRLRGLIAIALIPSAGCALFVTKSDYADYRNVRLTQEPDARAIAMQEYVQRHPQGHWASEIQATRKSEDVSAFESGKDTRAGLEHYLRAFPDGTFVAQARSRLVAVGLIEQRKQSAGREAQQLAETRKVRADELRRTWVGRFLDYWTQTLTGLHGWGEAIPDVARQNPQFSRAFGAQPRPRCTQDECLKYYTSQYAVPVPGGNRIERQISLVLRLRLRNGKLERAELLLPDQGFSRWFELENRRVVGSGDPELRKSAVTWAIEHALADITALGADVVALRDSSEPRIDRPGIGPTGELIDTSIEAPSDPQNHVSSEPDNAGIGVQATKPVAAPTTSELVKPNQEATPDMVFAPIGVTKQGTTLRPPATNPNQPAAVGGDKPEVATGEVMVIDPVAVPKGAGNDSAVTSSPTPSATTPIAPASTNTPAPKNAAPAQVHAFQWQGLHIVVFAAGSSGTYDGVIIERSTAPTTPKQRASVAKPIAPRTP
jgi:hypothetical protein